MIDCAVKEVLDPCYNRDSSSDALLHTVLVSKVNLELTHTDFLLALKREPDLYAHEIILDHS